MFLKIKYVLKQIAGFILEIFFKKFPTAGGQEQPKFNWENRATMPAKIGGEGVTNTTIEALKFWNEAIPNALEWSLNDPQIIVSYGDFEQEKNGRARMVEGKWQITIRKEFKNDRALLCHEIGHCLGLGHTKNIMSIMNPTSFNFQQITPEIVKVLNG